ncbi:MAG: riboflavin biosynthesis protein RibF [Bacteroidales bacterium]|jgi:riboflavin kinase/FMN adenylyltransferase|nr:riboflavin biosynthesis protein RibF [Bacteroidales bacterium]
MTAFFVQSDILPVAIYTDINHPDFTGGVVTVGSFDGVHRGHQALLKQVTAIAERYHCRSMVVTFATHPRMLLDKNTPERWLLNTTDEKNMLLAQAGIDDILILPFDREMSQMTANEFVRKIIIGKLHAKYWVVGEDHSFGKNRDGNAENIATLTDITQIQLFKEDLIKCECGMLTNKDTAFAEKISSSAIRKLLSDGQPEAANRMLGYEYPLSGKVIAGNRTGRTIGFPTANIEPPPNKILPRDGVYCVRTDLDGEQFYGMTYVGKRTVVQPPDDTPQVETHIFDFKRNIYGKILRLSFMHRIRDDIRFKNLEQLQTQLQRDEQQIRNLVCRV